MLVYQTTWCHVSGTVLFILTTVRTSNLTSLPKISYDLLLFFRDIWWNSLLQQAVTDCTFFPVYSYPCCLISWWYAVSWLPFSYQILNAEAQVQFQGFVMDKVELEQVLSKYFSFPLPLSLHLYFIHLPLTAYSHNNWQVSLMKHHSLCHFMIDNW